MATIITAKFAGTCSVCRTGFIAGTRIVHDKSRGRGHSSLHIECYHAERAKLKAAQAANLAAATVTDSDVSIALRTFDSPAALADACAGIGESSGGGEGVFRAPPGYDARGPFERPM
jgi:hypothetical protein